MGSHGDIIGSHGDRKRGKLYRAKPTAFFGSPQKIWDTQKLTVFHEPGFSGTLCSDETIRVRHKIRHGRQNSSVWYQTIQFCGCAYFEPLPK